MVSKRSVYNYWLFGDGNTVLSERGIEIADDSCFACGDHLILQRAHIKSHYKGGNGDAENLHILCSRCHIESECLSVKQYWDWLEYKNRNEYKTGIEHSLGRLIRIGFSMEKFKSVCETEGFDSAMEYVMKFVTGGDQCNE